LFGDGRWMNVAGGVFDIFTGQMAAFGSDSSDSVFYLGTRESIVRVVKASAGTQIQPWDTTNDLALSGAVTIKGGIPSWIDNDQPNQDQSWLLTRQYSNGLTLVLRAYSWQTGQMLWESALELGQWTSQCAALHISGSTIFVSMNITLADPPIDCSNPDYAVLDGGTGQVLVQNQQSFDVVGTGQTVVYMREAPDWVLTARDLASSDFETLWTVPDPGHFLGYLVAANHIIAWSQDTLELWVLQP